MAERMNEEEKEKGGRLNMGTESAKKKNTGIKLWSRKGVIRDI